MAGLQTCSGQLSGTLRRHTPMAGWFWAGQSSPKMDDLWGAHGCPYFRKASLILGASVFFFGVCGTILQKTMEIRLQHTATACFPQ